MFYDAAKGNRQVVQTRANSKVGAANTGGSTNCIVGEQAAIHCIYVVGPIRMFPSDIAVLS